MHRLTWISRIVGQDNRNKQEKQNHQDKQDSDDPVVQRPVTFLQHGLVGSSADWCIGDNTHVFYFHWAKHVSLNFPSKKQNI